MQGGGGCAVEGEAQRQKSSQEESIASKGGGRVGCGDCGGSAADRGQLGGADRGPVGAAGRGAIGAAGKLDVGEANGHVTADAEVRWRKWVLNAPVAGHDSGSAVWLIDVPACGTFTPLKMTFTTLCTQIRMQCKCS